MVATADSYLFSAPRALFSAYGDALAIADEPIARPLPPRHAQLRTEVGHCLLCSLRDLFRLVYGPDDLLRHIQWYPPS